MTRLFFDLGDAVSVLFRLVFGCRLPFFLSSPSFPSCSLSLSLSFCLSLPHSLRANLVRSDCRVDLE